MGGCASNDDQDPPPVKDKKRSKRASASTTTKGSPAPAESPQRETQTRTADVLLALTVDPPHNGQPSSSPHWLPLVLNNVGSAGFRLRKMEREL